MTFFLEAQKFFGKRLKMVVTKFRQKFGSPVSEVLDPLVQGHSTTHPKIWGRDPNPQDAYVFSALPQFTCRNSVTLYRPWLAVMRFASLLVANS